MDNTDRRIIDKCTDANITSKMEKISSLKITSMNGEKNLNIWRKSTKPPFVGNLKNKWCIKGDKMDNRQLELKLIEELPYKEDKMDNRVFYSILSKLRDLDCLPINAGDYEIIRDDYTILFYYKGIVQYTLGAGNPRWIAQNFEKNLKTSDIIAFKFNFNIKESQEVKFKVIDIGFILTKEEDTFYCWVDGGYEKLYFFKLQLTDEQIEIFKVNRFAFSDYLRSEVL